MKMHWYCFSFAYSSGSTAGHACSYQGFEHQGNFTHSCIQAVKAHALPTCPKSHMVLVAITYLGYMTAEEFNGHA